MSGTDHELDGFIAESRAGLEGRIEKRRRGLDFLDAIERASALDANRVGAAAVEEARSLAPVVDIRSSQDETADDVELDAFVSEVRAAVHHKVVDHQLRPVPAMRRRRRGAWRVVGVAVGAVAAVALGWVALGEPQLLERQTDEVPTEQAVDSGIGPTTARGDVVERGERHRFGSNARSRGVAPTREVADAEPETVELSSDEPAVEHEPAVEDEPAVASTRRTLPRLGQKDERLRGLLEQASTQWRAGDLSGAEKTLRRVVRIGGRSRHVQSAYADLFLLAHRAGDEPRRRGLWKAYLRKFPRGRFADDARAGLCRTTAGSDSDRCWKAYLDEFERGSYRAEATRALR